jgi:hypothetical protein
MVRDGTYTAVLDRFEGEYAIVQLEADGEALDQVMVERADLPEVGRHQDAVFTVKVSDTELVAVEYEPETTEERQADAQDRFDRLSQRLDDESES